MKYARAHRLARTTHTQRPDNNSNNDNEHAELRPPKHANETLQGGGHPVSQNRAIS